MTAAAVALAEERGALCILEPPAAWSTVDQAVAGASAPAFLRSPNAAMYFPRLAGPGPLRGPAGAVAGVIARSDVLRGVWAAPAGVEAALRWVDELSVPVSDAENGRLNSLGVNCLRNFAGAGPVVWGARTTADESDADWKYVNVRRLGLFLEQSLSRGLQWAVFEPNDEPLWGRIRAEAGAFLDDLFHRCAFVGTTPREAYFVKCDGDTTTQDDIDNGRINLVVGFAPSRPAEFVNLRIGLVAPTTTHASDAPAAGATWYAGCCEVCPGPRQRSPRAERARWVGWLEQTAPPPGRRRPTSRRSGGSRRPEPLDADVAGGHARLDEEGGGGVGEAAGAADVGARRGRRQVGEGQPARWAGRRRRGSAGCRPPSRPGRAARRRRAGPPGTAPRPPGAAGGPGPGGGPGGAWP